MWTIPVLLVVVLGLVACEGKRDPVAREPAPGTPPTERVEGTSAQVDEHIAKLRAHADALCACKDRACKDRVLAEHLERMPAFTDANLTPEQYEQLGRERRRLDACNPDNDLP